MDRLSFCRQNLDILNDDELLEIYNLLCLEYGDGEFALINNIEHIEPILELLDEFNLTLDDWKEAIIHEQYVPSDKYIEISKSGVISMSNEDFMISWINKKMNGEAINMIEGYLQNKGVKLPKYVVVHDVENEEFHLHTLCADGNPSSKKVLVGCDSLHEVFVLSANYGIEKKDIVDYLKIDEIKQYS